MVYVTNKHGIPFHPDNSDRCSAVFINKGATVDFGLDVVTFEFAGTGPGILPENTVSEFTCIFNGINIPRDCKSEKFIIFFLICLYPMVELIAEIFFTKIILPSDHENYYIPYAKVA